VLGSTTRRRAAAVQLSWPRAETQKEKIMNRHATAVWSGNLKEGTGTLDTQSGILMGQPYSFKTRFEDESGRSGTNPEELIAAAHAGCFAMQFSHFLAENGSPATRLEAKAVVTLVPGTGITGSALSVRGTVPGIDAGKFTELAEKAKAECPVSKALGSIGITLQAALA
jgi:osmotically inducible protein OsmC